VTAISQETLLLVILVFCRVAGCLMVMPGFSSSRVPMQIRLFLAVSATLALSPMLGPVVKQGMPDLAPTRVLVAIGSETAIGLLIGLTARIFFVALTFIGTAITMFIGFGGTPDTLVEDGDPAPALASLITLTATVLFFVADLHIEVLKAIIETYGVLPAGSPLPSDLSLQRLSSTMSDAFMLVLQISGPFVAWSLIINFMFGLLNKLTPQVPVFFISVPFVLAGGLVLAYFSVGEVLQLFVTGFAQWLWRG
jgi:flagellar biosynthetic protein FliR